jgi:hypothetical protein
VGLARQRLYLTSELRVLALFLRHFPPHFLHLGVVPLQFALCLLLFLPRLGQQVLGVAEALSELVEFGAGQLRKLAGLLLKDGLMIGAVLGHF